MHCAGSSRTENSGFAPSDRRLARIAARQKKLQEKIESHLCRLPAYLRYRNAALLDLLRRVVSIMEHHDLDCLVGGGLAYDALRGRLTRVHHDLDLVCSPSRRAAILAAFRAAGFAWEEKSPYHSKAQLDKGLHVDLFFWVEVGEEAVEHICGGVLVRMPRAFLATRQTACLGGLRLTLPSNDYLKSIRPFVESAADRRFLNELATNPLVIYDQRSEMVVRRINLAIHEFSIAPEPRQGLIESGPHD